MFDDTFYYNSMFWSFIFKRVLDEKFYEQKKIEEKKSNSLECFILFLTH